MVLVNHLSTVSISKLVNSLKGVSSRLIRKQNHASITASLWGPHLWSPSYFARSCGGAPLEMVKQYIWQQQTPID